MGLMVTEASGRELGSAFQHLGKDVIVRTPLGLKRFDTNDPTEAMAANVIVSPNGISSIDKTMLSTAERYEIQPGASQPNRLAHVADILHLTIAIGRKLGYPEPHIRAVALFVATGDLAHGPFSHLSDYVKEGVGGPESAHDREAHQILYIGGLYDAARYQLKFDFPDEHILLPGEIGDYPIPGWAECPRPGLNVDSLQYATYELLTKYGTNHSPKEDAMLEYFSALGMLDRFDFRTGDMVFKEAEDAAIFAKGYLTLSEHWNSKLKRTSDQLLVFGMETAILQRALPDMDKMDHGQMHYPLDYLHTTDSYITEALQSPNASEELALIDRLLAQFGTEGQADFAHDANQYISFIMDEAHADFPSLSEEKSYTLLKAWETANPTISQREAAAGMILLKAPKYRTIDPLVMTVHGPQRLSTIGTNYKAILVEHEHTYKKHWVGALALNGDELKTYNSILSYHRRFRRLVRAGGGPPGSDNTPHTLPPGADWDAVWEAAGFYPNMTDTEIGDLILQTAKRATRRALGQGVLQVEHGTAILDFDQNNSRR